MIEHPAFIEWLPTMAERSHETGQCTRWPGMARSLRARIQVGRDDGGAATPAAARP